MNKLHSQGLRMQDVFSRFALLLNWFLRSKKQLVHHVGALVECDGSNRSAAGTEGAVGVQRKPDGCLDGTEFLHLNQQEMELWLIIHNAPS